MREIRCNTCGSNRYEERRIDYLYSHKGKYLLVPNTPVESCLDCGMIYYDAAVLKEIERHFFAIHQQNEMPIPRLKTPARVPRKELFVKGRSRIFLKSP
ncbi:type II toxin-antitoxin system MqsA family antitoxin [Microcoleus vaginatus]|uniref:type II toxin-antitoxin system MqsA family antitoxin n=1 Tax=Microcoleus vaginatus TaxID=119532 RepID=UPI001F612608|nr:type II toxin-antitoxin system MqsA family antitoxin [Microcoleus vaginatus HSN003]